MRRIGKPVDGAIEATVVGNFPGIGCVDFEIGGEIVEDRDADAASTARTRLSARARPASREDLRPVGRRGRGRSGPG